MLLGAWAGLCLALFSSSPARAANANDLLPGGRAMGMGMSYAAVADDPWAMWANPAGTANTPYTQAATELGRLQSPVGTLTSFAAAYLRPYEPIHTASVGLGYYLGRQVNGLDKDEFIAHYSQEFKAPSSLALTKPLRFGGNFKILNEAGEDGKGVGLGFDGAVQLRSGFGLTSAVSIRDFTTNSKISPTLSIANAYTYKRWLTAALDMRIRRSLTELYPGVEAQFLQGLLSVRAGKAFQLDTVRGISFGLGVNLSPMILDIGATLPASRVHQGGGFEFSLTYKFGAPSFAGNFVGGAAAEAEALRAQLEELKDKRQEAEAQTKSADVKREIAEGELHVVEQRLNDAQDQYRQAVKRSDQAGYDAEQERVKLEAQAAASKPAEPPLIRKPAPPAPRRPLGPQWPKKHDIQPGETLRTLAGRYYGDAALWEKIYDANKDKIERGLPQEGSTFVIPDPNR